MAQERRVARNLELQDGPGSSAPYMELQDTGKELADQWQLRDDVDVTNWQPIEYERPTPPKTNWILPSLVGVMLLAVLSYVGWIGYNRFGSGTASVPALATATLGPGIANMAPILFSAAGNLPGLAPGIGLSIVTFMGYSGLLVAPATIGFVAERTGFAAIYAALAILILAVAAFSREARHADMR